MKISKRWLVGAALLAHCGPMASAPDAMTDGAAMEASAPDASEPDANAPDASVPDAREGGAAHEGDVTRGRLLVADGRTGSAQLWDLDSETRVGMFVLGAPASAAGESVGGDGVGFLAQRTLNRTDVVSSGIEFHQHDEHYHVVKRAPSLLAERAVLGMLPTHVTSHDGWTAIFHDGDATVTYFADATMFSSMPSVRTWTAAPAHHGVAVVAFGQLLASIPDPIEPAMGATRLPIGVSWRDRANVTTEGGRAESCPVLHGEAANETSVAFGCGDGVLVLRWDNAMSRFVAQKIANPVDASPGTRIGTLAANHESPVFVGNWGSQSALTLVDPAANMGAGAITPVPLAARPLAFAFDSEGAKILALTLDGRVHRLDGRTGAADGAPLMAIPAYEAIPSGEGAVRPAIAVTGDRMYVSDPRDGTIRVIDLDAWALGAQWMVGGAPASLRVLSMSPDFHGHAH